MSDPQRPHGLQPTRLLHPWYFPGKSTGVGCHCLSKGNGYQLLYTCLENSMDCGAWQATAHGVAKSGTQLEEATLCTFQIPYSSFNETLCWASAPSMGENSCTDSTLNITKMIIYTRQWSSYGGDFAPLGTFLLRTGDIFCCRNWGCNWHVIVRGQGYC